MAVVVPRFSSDLDGTGVEKYGKVKPRNWIKYPLPMKQGFTDFVEGVQATGVPFDGFITIRKEWLRKGVTERSMRKLGFMELMGSTADPVVYAGNEASKAQEVVRRSRLSPLGMLEDNPQKLGVEIINTILEQPEESVGNSITLGVVWHPDAQQRMGALRNYADQLDGVTTWDHAFGLSRAHEPGFTVGTPLQKLEVVHVGPYSQQTGQVFGEWLQTTTN